MSNHYHQSKQTTLLKKLFITLAVLLCCAMAFADNPFVFGCGTVQYNKISMNSNGYSTSMDGVTMGAGIFFNVSGNWYADLYPNVQVGWRMKNESGLKTADAFCSIKPSLGMSYRIPISDKCGIAIYPNAGFDIGAYVVGASGYSGYKVDWFKDLDYNKFILNWHAGAALTVKQIVFIIRYEGYIVSLYNKNGEKLGLNQWSFGIGITI